MRKIPKKLLDDMLSDPYYKRCARQNCECNGRITLEHAFIYAGRQINEKWAIIPLCWYHHLGTGLVKDINQWIALSRATPEELAKYPRGGWEQKLKYLEGKYGIYHGKRT